MAIGTVAVGDSAAQSTSQLSVNQHAHGFVAAMPGNSSYSNRSGLRLEVDSRWPNNFGYRPVRVRIESRKSTNVAQRIRIRLHVATWDWQSGDLAVEQDFDLPMGEKSAETVIACPQFHSGHRYWWETWVDGVLDKELCVVESSAWQLTASGSVNATNTALKFLMVGTPAESQRVIGLGSDVFEALVLAREDFPTRWIDYTAIDVVALSPDDLEVLSEARPEVLAALRRWVRAGGQIWISPAGNRWQQLEVVEQLLELPPVDFGGAVAGLETADSAGAEYASRTPASVLDPAIAARGWKPIEFRPTKRETTRVGFIHTPTNRLRIEHDPAIIARLKSDPDFEVTDLDAASPNGESNDAPTAGASTSPYDSAKWYLQRPQGLGYVRVFRREWDPVGFGISWQMLFGATPNDVSSMPTPLAAAIETTRTWEARHGMTPDTASLDFADQLVPGVGLAPVSEFRVLITVFVLAIGPLNYWLLLRTNRLHLLVLTVPAVALTLTASLFAYALIADGLSTTARVRSFTWLDQQTGEAACWARLSYYSGLAPGNGLTMPDDVTLYPILPGWNESEAGGNSGTSRQMKWTADQQRLSAEWLRSRTPMQYLSIRARKSPHRLELRPAGEQMSAANELGARITFVAVLDQSGRLFSGESIGQGATVVLDPTDSSDVLRRLRQLAAENRPVVPPELTDEFRGLFNVQGRQRRRFTRSTSLEYGTAHLADNLQNLAIASVVESFEDPIRSLPPRSYVAVTETGPEVALGAPGMVEEGSFHVLVGRW